LGSHVPIFRCFPSRHTVAQCLADVLNFLNFWSIAVFNNYYFKGYILQNISSMSYPSTGIRKRLRVREKSMIKICWEMSHAVSTCMLGETLVRKTVKFSIF
jgi:hypothetical protein